MAKSSHHLVYSFTCKSLFLTLGAVNIAPGENSSQTCHHKSELHVCNVNFP